MKIITRICLLIIALGVVLGWFLLGGLWGSVGGFLMAGVVAIPVYCLPRIFAYNSGAVWEDPLQDTPSSVPLDRSQLPVRAYESHGGSGSGM